MARENVLVIVMGLTHSRSNKSNILQNTLNELSKTITEKYTYKNMPIISILNKVSSTSLDFFFHYVNICEITINYYFRW